MIRTFEVDGVPTLLAPTGDLPHAGLVFRVGRADESLARAGLTHLVEHLALAPLGQVDHDFNGATGPVFTYFHSRGSEAHLAEFLTSVCRNLHDLPTDRLDTEKEILRTEWSNGSTPLTGTFPLWRYGARDHGLTSFPELGLPAIGPDELRDWVARFFTRDNAVLWIAGDRVPAGLRLPLPAGTRQPVPAASSALPRTPAYFHHGDRMIALEAVVRRRTAVGVFTGVLKRELFRSLRQRDGLSYTATAGHESRGDGYTRVRALADALPEKQYAVLGGFVDVLAKLRVGRIEQADLDAAVARRTELLGTAEVHAQRLPSYAFNLLTGERNLEVDEHRAELAAVTLADLHEVAREVATSALLMVPEGCRAEWAGFEAAPTRSEKAVVGTTYPAWDGSGRLLVGADGVSHVDPAGILTVRYDECAIMQAWPDGGRQLIDHDGIVLRVEPNLFRLPAEVLREIDEAVPADRQVALPERPASAIPQPPPAPTGVARAVERAKKAGTALSARLGALLTAKAS